MNPAGQAPWWSEAAPAEATPPRGLSPDEALELWREHGPNVFRDQPRRPWWWQLALRFRNPLVLILLLASAISALTGEVTNFFIIAGIVCLSVTLDFVQESRATKAAERLRASVSVRASVVRGGQTLEVPVTDLVPGDLVCLSAGSLVPADAWVVQANDFFVKQAMLTGEPYPVEKRPGRPSQGVGAIDEAHHAVFMGTSVISGSALVRVARTGARTAIGEIAQSITRELDPTSFELGLRRFGMLIMRMTFLMVLFVLLMNTWFHKPLLESFLFAVALAVGLTPELLPMVVSVTLSRGALRMAEQHMIVKRQSAIQDLGSMDVLCTDKTGTLTEARVRMEQHVDPRGQSSERVLELAYLNSFFESGLKSPLDDAILAHRHIEMAGWSKVDEVPFDFERRRVSVLLDRTGLDAGAQRCLVVKGAPEDVLALCSRVDDGRGGELALDEASLAQARAVCHGLEAEGFRVLGIAWRSVAADHPHAVVGDESELVLAGFAAFLDPPRASAALALRDLQAAGVAVKVVTGDSDLVTRHVCRELGIEVTGVLLGHEVAALDEGALQARVEAVNLFCRVSPAQKERVIRALRARGHVVGYLGDGINDAPSLHAADVGLSVDSAVDVAKEAADIILMEQDLRVLNAGVREGRRTFGNIMKYIMMGTSSNFGNMFSMAGAAVFLPFLPMLPTQILLNNILYDLSELAIPLDEVDEQETLHPRVMDIAFIRNFMWVIGPVSSVFDLLAFYLMWVVMQAPERLFQTGWFVESLCTQVLVIFVIRTRGNPLRSRAHPWLVASSCAVVLAAAVLPYTAWGHYLGFVPPPWHFYPVLGGLVLTYLLVVEVIKQWFYRHLGGPWGPQRPVQAGSSAS